MTAQPLPVSAVGEGSGAPSSAAGRALSQASSTQDRALVRQVVVGRLLALGKAGSLETVHVRIAAESVGVSVRTVWRWLAQARESGRVGPAPRRAGFAFTDALWTRLSDVGGNVKAL